MNKYLSDEDILAYTILREGGERGLRTYDSIAWLIYNRFKIDSDKFGSTPKQVCLKIGQFETWSPFWGVNDIQSEDVDLNIKTHFDYDYCSQLARQILNFKQPTETDPTNGATHYLCMTTNPKEKHPNGIELDEHWFFK